MKEIYEERRDVVINRAQLMLGVISLQDQPISSRLSAVYTQRNNVLDAKGMDIMIDAVIIFNGLS